MARVTVEDCLAKLPNRFRLIRLATKRARQLAMGSDDARVIWENDKPTVVALREIAEGFVNEAMFENVEEPKPKQHEETEVDIGAAFASMAAQFKTPEQNPRDQDSFE